MSHSLTGTTLLSSRWTYPGSACLPVTREESVEGRRTLRNQASRTHRILNQEEIEQGKQARWLELELHGMVNCIGMEVLNMRHLTALFASHNCITNIPKQISQLNNLTVLDLSFNQITGVPPEIGDMGSLVHLNLANNKITSLPPELGKLFRLKALQLQNNPLPGELTMIHHGVSGTKDLLQHLLDSLATNTTPPPARRWITIESADPSKPSPQFTVMCYNVLWDKCATQNLYYYCPTWALNWEYRKNAIIKEIIYYDSDVVALQEVEAEQYKVLFEPELRARGYEGVFAPRSRAKTMVGEDRKHVDGCALFWKTTKFKLEHQHVVEFAQIAINKAHRQDSIINRVMPKDNIALMATLSVLPGIYKSKPTAPIFSNDDRRSIGRHTPAAAKTPTPADECNVSAEESVVGHKIILCAAHVYWDPEFCDVKLIQSMMLVHECARQIERVALEEQITVQEVPLIICGDFNSLPDSGVIEYLTAGRISKEHPDLKTFQRDMVLNGLCTNEYGDHEYMHALRLESGMDTSTGVHTNFTPDFKGMIDYILSSPQSLRRHGYLGGIDPQWIVDNKIVGFPHPHIPSDHVPVMAQYSLTHANHRRPAVPVARFRRRSNSFSQMMEHYRDN